MAWELADAVGPLVELDYPRRDNTTLREHLESYCRQTGQWDERLNPPRIPDRVAHLWEWFWGVIEGKGDAGFWVTLQAWQAATGNELTPDEVETMTMMYRQYERAVSKKLGEK